MRTFTTPLPNTVGGGLHGQAEGTVCSHWAAQHELTLPPQELHKPTHFPYNQELRPRRLDYVFTKGVTAAHGQVIQCQDRTPLETPVVTPFASGKLLPRRGDTEVAETGGRSTFFIRDMMIRLPRAAPEQPSKPPKRGLASTFLRVALESDRDVRAQQASGEIRQYPAGAMPDKAPFKRVRF